MQLNANVEVRTEVRPKMLINAEELRAVKNIIRQRCRRRGRRDVGHHAPRHIRHLIFRQSVQCLVTVEIDCDSAALFWGNKCAHETGMSNASGTTQPDNFLYGTSYFGIEQVCAMPTHDA